MKIRLLCLLILVLAISGCSKKSESNPYVIPVNYTGEASMKSYTEQSENDYKLNIICRDNNYSFRVDTGAQIWNVAFLSGNRCVINNDKFPENSVSIENFKLSNSLKYDFDLTKFNRTTETIPDELVYFDGTYKHVLNFSKETMLPTTIFIYKNDNLVKTITYDKINIEE